MATTVHRSKIDLDGDKRIDAWEWKQYTRGKDKTKEYSYTDINGKDYTGKLSDLTDQLSGEFEAAAAADNPEGDLSKKVETLVQRMESILRELKQAEANGDKQKAGVLQQKLNQFLSQVKQHNGLLKNKGKGVDLSKFEQTSGRQGGKGLGSFKAQSSTGGAGGQQPANAGIGGRNAGQGPKANKAPGGFAPPSNWGSGNAGMPLFDSSAFIQAQMMTDEVMKSHDAINKNSNKGKQLMMLFHYYARMAASGDMTAMYQLMKFFTVIISKDKAKQQIEMGKKLIQLQDASRQWTNKLLGIDANSSDPASSNELMKQMTLIKSETDAIATSQKLISQMMEEFAQIVETLTNTTKAALETAGRISRTVSTMR